MFFRLLILLFVLLLLFSLKATWLLFSHDYSSLITYIRNTYPNGFDINQIGVFFTEKRFYFARTISIFYTLLFCVLLSFLSILRRQLSYFFARIDVQLKQLLHSFANTFTTLSTKEKSITISVLLLILCHYVFVLTKSPFRVDDICSYVFFAHEGFMASALFYPDVNNHFFYNIVCSILDLLPLSPETVMLVPSGLAYFSLLILIFIFVNKKWGFLTAIIALILCGFMKPSVVYATQGRGYMMMALFAFIFIVSVFEFIKSPDKKVLLIFLIFSGILGGYTLPSFLLILIPASIYGIWRLFRTLELDYSHIKLFILSIAICGFGLFLLYTPVLLINGLDRLNNPWVQSKGFTYYMSILPVSIAESIDYLFGVSKKGYLLAVLFSCGSIYVWKKDRGNARRWIHFFVFLIAGTFLFISVRTSFPPYRTWTYVSFILNISTAVLLGFFLNTLRNNTIKYLSILAILALCILPHLTNRYIPDRDFFLRAQNVAASLVSQEPQNILVDRKDILFYYLKLEAVKKGNFIVDEKASPLKSYSLVVQYGPEFPTTDSTLYAHQFNWEDCKVFRLK